MARKVHVSDDTIQRIRQDSEDLETSLGKSISDRYKKAIEQLYVVEDTFDQEGNFPSSEINLVIRLAPKIIKTKGIQEFDKVIDNVYRILQEGKNITKEDVTDHHWISVGTITVLCYSEETHQKIRDYIGKVADQIRRVTCSAGLEAEVEIKKDNASNIMDEIRDWYSKETARKPDFPDLEVVLIIEGKVRVPFDNVRSYTSAPKKFEMYGKTDHLDLVSPQWPKTKQISSFICHGIDGRCYDACKYHTNHNKKA